MQLATICSGILQTLTDEIPLLNRGRLYNYYGAGMVVVVDLLPQDRIRAYHRLNRILHIPSKLGRESTNTRLEYVQDAAPALPPVRVDAEFSQNGKTANLKKSARHM